VSAKVNHVSLGFAGIPRDEAGLDAGIQEDGGVIVGEDGGLGAADAGTDGEVRGEPRTIVVTSRDPWGGLGNQTWAAFQDGDGPWTQLGSSTLGVYQFEIVTGRYGFAYVCADGSGSEGQIVYAQSTRSALSIVQGPFCRASLPVSATRSGTATSATDGNILYAHRFGTGVIPVIGGMPTGYSVDGLLQNYTTDIVFAQNTGVTVDRFLGVRNVMPPPFESDPVDFSGGYAAERAVATLTNSDTAVFDVRLGVSGSSETISMAGARVPNGVGGMTTEYAVVPDQLESSNDRYHVVASSTQGFNTRSVERVSQSSGALSVALPAAFTPSDVSQAGTTYFGPSMTFANVTGATSYGLSYAFPEGSFKMTADAAWFTGAASTHTWTFPDLTGVSAFDPAWTATTDTSPVNVSASVTSESGDTTNSLKAVSTYDVMFTIAP
jgi:hypothetical protein